MNCKFINVLMFAAGAAIGSAVTWKVVKTKYEQLVQEEIESVKAVFSNRDDSSQEYTEDSINTRDDSECVLHPDGTVTHINWDELEDLDEEEDESPEENDADTYARLVNNYTNEKGGAERMTKDPYVIGPYDFGIFDDYHQIELTYYADGILEDEDGNIVTDADELLGVGALNTFGEYEDDAVHVRNERLRTDFEILKDYRTHSEARGVGPKRVDNE